MLSVKPVIPVIAKVPIVDGLTAAVTEPPTDSQPVVLSPVIVVGFATEFSTK